MPFQIIRNDITKVKADAIVNTANPDVAIGDGVDSAIYEAAGRDDLLAARKEIGELPVGQAAITPAFKLDAKYIIHVSGPWWEEGSHGEPETLRSCYDRALNIAFDNDCRSIAFPLLATGTYQFPKELGMQIAIDSFTDFLMKHDMQITLVVFGSDTHKISKKLFDNVESFIDDDYVYAAYTKEYRHDRLVESLPSSHDRLVESLPLSLDDALKNIYTDSFSKHLKQILNKKGYKNSEVYVRANLSKQYFSKLLKDQVKPSKEKVLALACGLQLNLDETVDFLRIAGYALSPINQTDTIVRYCIEHKTYNVIKVDMILFDYGLDGLTYDPE